MKYKALTVIVSYFLFITWMVNSLIPNTTATPITRPTGAAPSGVLDALGGVLDYLKTFWDIMTFQITGVGYFISLSFIVCSLVLFMILISLIRGVE